MKNLIDSAQGKDYWRLLVILASSFPVRRGTVELISCLCSPKVQCHVQMNYSVICFLPFALSLLTPI